MRNTLLVLVLFIFCANAWAACECEAVTPCVGEAVLQTAGSSELSATGMDFTIMADGGNQSFAPEAVIAFILSTCLIAIRRANRRPILTIFA
jgi:hypothetical protein